MKYFNKFIIVIFLMSGCLALFAQIRETEYEAIVQQLPIIQIESVLKLIRSMPPLCYEIQKENIYVPKLWAEKDYMKSQIKSQYQICVKLQPGPLILQPNNKIKVKTNLIIELKCKHNNCSISTVNGAFGVSFSRFPKGLKPYEDSIKIEFLDSKGKEISILSAPYLSDILTKVLSTTAGAMIGGGIGGFIMLALEKIVSTINPGQLEDMNLSERFTDDYKYIMVYKVWKGQYSSVNGAQTIRAIVPIDADFMDAFNVLKTQGIGVAWLVDLMGGYVVIVRDNIYPTF